MVEVCVIRLNCQSVEAFVMITLVLDMQTRLEGCSQTVKSKRVGDGRLYNDEQGARDTIKLRNARGWEVVGLYNEGHEARETTKQWNARSWETVGYIMMNRVLEIQPNSGMPEGGRE